MMRSHITEGVAFLASQQAIDGSFMGQASTSVAPFKATHEHPTIFFTSLIMWCLRDVAGTESIRQKAAAFLQQQVSPHGSWNYWQRNSAMAREHPYPDDLDDTTCALLALHSFDTALVDGEALAQLAKLLIATETAPGGPYRTWLVDLTATQWQDVDIVVNANIGALLALHDTTLSGLNQFLDSALRDNTLTSPYYVGPVPTLYFLSRWYRGPQLPALKKLVGNSLISEQSSNSLHLALLVTAARNLQLPAPKTALTRKQLLAAQHDRHWPAEALYVDPNVQGKQYYAGSAALTTAFALEALSDSPPPKSKRNLVIKTASTQAIIQMARITSQTLPTALSKHYQSMVKQIAARDSDGQISGMATLTAKAYGHDVDEQILEHLNLGSLNGWIAYSIYDDFLDEEGQLDQLGVAHYALRQSLHHFAQALPGNIQFSTLVDETFVTMDAASLWEVTHARAQCQKDTLRYDLPVYGEYRQLAERSWGHTLAACGVLLATDNDQLLLLQDFFRHFLIARQLNDDAHDWESDLQQGHLSAVVCLLLKEHGASKTINLKTQLPALRQTFWRSTINQVAKQITDHTQRARQALIAAGVSNPGIFLSWIGPLEASAEQAVTSSHETQKFITAYQR